jgi:hypothetical protein
LSKLPIPFKVARILVHGDLDHAGENGEDAVQCFQSFLEFNVFVPERVSQEVKADTVCAPFEQPLSD